MIFCYSSPSKLVQVVSPILGKDGLRSKWCLNSWTAVRVKIKLVLFHTLYIWIISILVQRSKYKNENISVLKKPWVNFSASSVIKKASPNMTRNSYTMKKSDTFEYKILDIFEWQKYKNIRKSKGNKWGDNISNIYNK